MTNVIKRRDFLSYGIKMGSLVMLSPMLMHMDELNAKTPVGLTPLIEIHPDNTLTFYSPSPDMGQGVDTSLAMLFAEEIDADFDKLSTKPMPVHIDKTDAGKLRWKVVPQGAGGSTSIPRNWTRIRDAAATLRRLLLQAGATYFNVDVEQLRLEKSQVISPDGQTINYGQLVDTAANEVLPDNFSPSPKTRAEGWSIIGTHQKQKVARDIVKGAALYTLDMDYPEAKIALIARCPYFDGFVEKLDQRQALKLDGVHKIIILDRPDINKNYTYLAAGVAVIADNFWVAKKARDLLKITWNKGPHAKESSESLDNQCQALLKTQGQVVRHDGDTDKAISKASTVITRTYKLPLVSHAQLEPQNCIAHVNGEQCTIIGPLQSPRSAANIAEQITGIDSAKMDIRYPRLGGGFGRRLAADHVAEAVTVSKMSGFAIKLIWTREDDMAHDFYRPMGHHEMTAAFDAQGSLSAWVHRLAGTPKYYRRDNVKPEDYFKADLYTDDFPAGLVSNLKNEYFIAKSGAPQGSWRAPAHTANAFVVQSFLDELADALGEDPLALRLKLLGEGKKLAYGQHGGPTFDTGRLSQVLKNAAKMADWGRTMPKGFGQGIAGHFTFGGYCAQVAEVELLGDRFKVQKIYAAIDVGTVINRAGIIAQMEGGINDGLSAALNQKINIVDGQVVTKNFDTYPMMRMADSVPEIEVAIIDSQETPSGMGEMSLPPLAPAVANAVVRAGGRRMRTQPFVNS